MKIDGVEGVQIRKFTHLVGNVRVANILVEPISLEEKTSVVIYNRGGNNKFGSIGDKQIMNILAPLARQNFIVFASQYRGGEGSDGVDEFGGRDLDDVLALYEVIKAHPHADIEHIGMFGESRGGMMTFLALKKCPWIKAAATVGGMADLSRMKKLRPEMGNVFEKCFGGGLKDIRSRSALRWVKKIPKTTPILLMHGSADWRVSPLDTLDLSKAFIREHIPFRTMIFEGGDHAIREHRRDVMQVVMQWFKSYLQEGAILPSLEPHGS